jgi:beta-galactosidase
MVKAGLGNSLDSHPMTSSSSLVRFICAPMFILLALRAVPARSALDGPRTTESFDRSWKFHLGDVAGAQMPGFNDSSWRSVDLPHDWSIEGPPNIDPKKRGTQDGPFDRNSPAGNGGGYLNGGVGWYRKTFNLPEADKGRHVTILFDGAYENADVTLNDQKLGTHPYGFTSFYYDLTPYLKFGNEKNVLAVRLEDDQPGCRWYSGAGLYRHVYMIVTSPVHVAQWGTYVTTPTAAETGAQVKVATHVKNDGAGDVDAAITTMILDPDGKEVARSSQQKKINTGGEGEFDSSLSLPHARLWSLQSPVLYHAVNEVRVGDHLVDSTTTPFGIRTIEFTRDKGFFLNGQHVQIQGVCDHHDLGCLGSAAYRRAIQRQLEVLKSFGCNALRTSHNPPSPELLDLCDEMGFLVMDESFDEWKANHHTYGYGEFFDKWSEPDMLSMLHRDRNHPSIILWSIGNEISEGRSGKPEAGVMADRLVAICHREDPTRPVTSACPSPGNDWKSGLAKALDVFGINYSIGWYAKNNPANESTATLSNNSANGGYDGQLPLVGSETCSQVDSRCQYGLTLDAQGQVKILPKSDFQVSSYDLWHPGWAYSAETDLLALKNAPWVAGEFVWTGFDYLGEPTPYAWPSRSSYFGIVDLAGFPKDRYYLYKSQWVHQPLVHILPMSWNWPQFVGKNIPVRVFTNADSVELFLNGKSLGAKKFPGDVAEQTIQQTNKDKTVKYIKLPGMHLEWDVPYAPGELKAIAMDDGKVVATDIVLTAGEPAKILLTPDRARIAADGQDLSFISAKIVDANGVVCPDAENEIKFDLSGNAAVIAGLDNGDATNHEPFQGSQHKAYHGLALAVLKSKYDTSGSVQLTASTEGLTSARTNVTTVAP